MASREQAEKARCKEQAPALEVLRTAWRPLLLCIGANTLGIAGVYFTNTFMISYTTQQLHLERSLILECLFFVAIIQFCVQPLAAWLSEKIGATRFLALVALLAMASPYPMFVLVSSGQGPLIVLGIALAAACMASFYAVIAGYVSGMFDTRVRYTADRYLAGPHLHRPMVADGGVLHPDRHHLAGLRARPGAPVRPQPAPGTGLIEPLFSGVPAHVEKQWRTPVGEPDGHGRNRRYRPWGQLPPGPERRGQGWP
ncbi:Proline/betaine transporter [compost metagenome]